MLQILLHSLTIPSQSRVNMDQISSLDFDLEGFQTTLDSFYDTLPQTSPTTSETIAKLEKYADAVDQDLGKYFSEKFYS